MKFCRFLIIPAAALFLGMFASNTVWLKAESAGRAFFSPTPLGEVTTDDGIVQGVLHVVGSQLSFFSGDRFESTDKDLSIHFESGGSLNLCPRSRMQLAVT